MSTPTFAGNLCRVCSNNDSRNNSITDTKLVEIFEKLAGRKLNRRDENRQSTSMCFSCITQLKLCGKLAGMARESAKTRTLQNTSKVTENDVISSSESGKSSMSTNREAFVNDEQEDVIGQEYVEQEYMIEIELTPISENEEADEIGKQEDKITKKNVIEGYYCKTCNRQCKSKSGLLRHEKQHMSRTRNKANITEDNKYISEDNSKNLLTLLKKKEYVCNTCNKAYRSLQSLTFHISVAHKKYICTTCNKGFNNISVFRNHKRIHEKVKSYACDKCTKTFFQLNKLENHMIIHAAEALTCSTCNMVFKHVGNLKQHMKIHEKKDESFTCNICHKIFYESRNLKRHIKIHTGDMPYPCKSCVMAFKHKISLKRHKQFHDGDKTYACNTCSLAFNDAASLETHNTNIHTETQDKQLVCNICSKTFLRNGALTQHMLTHTGEKQYSCNLCNVKFTKKQSLKAHEINVHNYCRNVTKKKDV